MDKREYFVMLYNQKTYLPLMEDDDDIARFETPEEAREAGKDSCLGDHFGFEVFHIYSGM